MQLILLVLAAVSADYYGYPDCQHYVEKPAWGNDGKPYGYEYGRSCIARSGNYGNDGNYGKDRGDYSHKDYRSYDKNSYDKDYKVSHDKYDDHSYDKNSYGKNSYYGASSESNYGSYDKSYDYSKDASYDKSYDHQSNDYSKDYSKDYSSKDRDYSKDYSSKDRDYSKDYSNSKDYSKDYSHSKDYSNSKDYSTDYSQGYSHDSNGDCDSETRYFKSTGSPTLIQCVSIACAPGQTYEYTKRALFQCHALEDQARATNGGRLPSGW